MTFHIITIFPKAIESYFDISVIGRAIKNKLIKIKFYNLLDFSTDKHGKVDDRAYGGGPGMVIQIKPLVRAIDTALRWKNIKKTKIILFTPSGKQFDNKKAKDLLRYDNIILIAGRYEGVDSRIKEIFKMEELSIGPYVLTGGEVPAMILVDAVSRNIKGVLGKEISLEEKRHGVGVPTYTRPEVFTYRKKKYGVPKVLLSGNHDDIKEWREKRGKS
jgi:tRNA (guanine37-N1)-methyltransferase